GYVSPDLNPLWPLRAVYDIGFQNAFAYEIEAGTGEIFPIPEKIFRHPKNFQKETKKPKIVKVGGSAVIVRVVRCRFVVANSLVCCKPRADYEPGRVMMAARMFPVQMFYCTLSVDRILGGVTVVRPAQQSPMHKETMRDYI